MSSEKLAREDEAGANKDQSENVITNYASLVLETVSSEMHNEIHSTEPPGMSAISSWGNADSIVGGKLDLQSEKESQVTKPDLIDAISGNFRKQSSDMALTMDDMTNPSGKEVDEQSVFPFPPKLPFKDFTGRIPLATGFNKRFRKCKSATFKLDGMSYLIGMFIDRLQTISCNFTRVFHFYGHLYLSKIEMKSSQTFVIKPITLTALFIPGLYFNILTV